MVHISMKSSASLISFLVLVFILSAVSSSYSKKTVDVNAICHSPNVDPKFCSDLLNSRPGGAAGADLVSICEYTIDVARGNVSNIIELVKSLMKKGFIDKKQYDRCLTYYGPEQGALGTIEKAKEMLKSGDYSGLAQAALTIMEDTDICSYDAYEPPPQPAAGAEVDALEQNGDVLYGVAIIIRAISKQLMQH